MYFGRYTCNLRLSSPLSFCGEISSDSIVAASSARRPLACLEMIASGMSLVVGLLHVASGPDPYLIGMPCACRARPPLLRLQVVTDIDDTIKSSGGVALAGIPLGGVDKSYERGSIYPGAFHFAAALSAQSMLGPPAPVAVLTARAEEVRAQKH